MSITRDNNLLVSFIKNSIDEFYTYIEEQSNNAIDAWGIQDFWYRFATSLAYEAAPLFSGEIKEGSLADAIQKTCDLRIKGTDGGSYAPLSYLFYAVKDTMDDDTESKYHGYWNKSVQKMFYDFFTNYANLFDTDPDVLTNIKVSDIKNANAGYSFEDAPWVKPNLNVDGKKYATPQGSASNSVRAKDRTLSVLRNIRNLQFTRTQATYENHEWTQNENQDTNEYLRLLMPKYSRRVEVEDLNRNFWCIAQVLAALSSYIFDMDSPLMRVLKNMLNEVAQLWENVMYLWMELANYSQNKYGNAHIEVLPLDSQDLFPTKRYQGFDNNKIYSAYESYLKDDSMDGADFYAKIKDNNQMIREIINRIDYLRYQYKNQNLVVIPYVRLHNYEENYYSGVIFPYVFIYSQARKNENKQSNGWFYFNINYTRDEEEFPLIISLLNKDIGNGSELQYTSLGAIRENPNSYTYVAPYASPSLQEGNPYKFFGLIRVIPDINIDFLADGIKVNHFGIKLYDAAREIYMNDEDLIGQYTSSENKYYTSIAYFGNDDLDEEWFLSNILGSGIHDVDLIVSSMQTEYPDFTQDQLVGFLKAFQNSVALTSSNYPLYSRANNAYITMTINNAKYKLPSVTFANLISKFNDQDNFSKTGYGWYRYLDHKGYVGVFTEKAVNYSVFSLDQNDDNYLIDQNEGNTLKCSYKINENRTAVRNQSSLTLKFFDNLSQQKYYQGEVVSYYINPIDFDFDVSLVPMKPYCHSGSIDGISYKNVTEYASGVSANTMKVLIDKTLATDYNILDNYADSIVAGNKFHLFIGQHVYKDAGVRTERYNYYALDSSNENKKISIASLDSYAGIYSRQAILYNPLTREYYSYENYEGNLMAKSDGFNPKKDSSGVIYYPSKEVKYFSIYKKKNEELTEDNWVIKMTSITHSLCDALKEESYVCNGNNYYPDGTSNPRRVILWFQTTLFYPDETIVNYLKQNMFTYNEDLKYSYYEGLYPMAYPVYPLTTTKELQTAYDELYSDYELYGGTTDLKYEKTYGVIS